METASEAIIDRIFAVDVVEEIAGNQELRGQKVDTAQMRQLAAVAQDSSFGTRVQARIDGTEGAANVDSKRDAESLASLKSTIVAMSSQAERLRASNPDGNDWSSKFPWRRNRGMIDIMIFRTNAMVSPNPMYLEL